ncbi:DUF3060 domain-containing protein [Actinomyces succiniciruminis]|uniref:Prokaryotic membrane lipoprotein lipid attachment site profile n=1 Tax=Actinomyces succiniciruminis TaxID=1522002 RepID=A0A1L7RM00_9ACTO|nr:DUF3060 domain-containing protein [Actinomyces succiniciruminis]CED91220.1 Prokaryotic membrane lipoprotein lipid attachment site profile [Actinomyces succiniciruminis]
MRIPNQLLVPATVIALGASLAACSISVGGSDGDSASEETTAVVATEEAPQTTGDTDDTDNDSDDAEDADADDADAVVGADTDDADAAVGASTADITDSDWLGVIANGTQENVSGDYAIQSSGGTYNLVGELNSLTIQGSEVTVSAENIGTLTVQGSDVTVYLRQADTIQVFGSDVTVYYLDGAPSIQDIGADNTVEQLTD